MFSRAMKNAVAEKIVTKRFTFHDLRAHYATQHKRKVGALPDLHADPGTTARVYERSQESPTQGALKFPRTGIANGSPFTGRGALRKGELDPTL